MREILPIIYYMGVHSSRANYIDGSTTPLFRGLIHAFTWLGILYYIITNFAFLKALNIWSMIMISSSYFISVILHCIKLPGHIEIAINLIDHLAIHHHIFGVMLIKLFTNNFLPIIYTLFLINYLIDGYGLYFFRMSYIHSRRHISHYVWSISLAIINFLNYCLFTTKISIVVIFLMGCATVLYVTGLIIYAQNMKNKIPNHIWSFHESFHLFSMMGTIIILYLSHYHS
ncbi:MAG: hypothetical protein Harvfovirus21_13 [Harvfovirus sp.]|uniref:Hemolysin III n=1 Tax=Harvfovirus sp. TaxID=2487768 RepID=A0A3G5A1W3_9VIRU|nr:MAG: hypothetical protein Harvfovirus21_13 [Harvfovirus sp.]